MFNSEIAAVEQLAGVLWERCRAEAWVPAGARAAAGDDHDANSQ
jgi:hypothetical protein